MEEDQEKVVSAQKSLQPVHDSGWNDPPSWALQKSTTATPTKRLLNKRVAFPMNSNSESSSSITPSTPPSSVSSNTPPSSATPNTQPTPNLPPPPEVTKLTTAPHKPTVAPTGVSTDDSLSSLSELDMNKDEALNNTLYNLNSAISTLDSSKAEEIQKRLEKMESMWKEDKLNSAVYKKVYEISNALINNDGEKADQLHILLMMHNASICSSWIPGIRQLITEIKNTKL